ncbi:MAG TPA: glycosyltransferase [Gammaproteobacteria bacterium]|nr:glycosyltransferase [Gammaproteobacteria bacterium]
MDQVNSKVVLVTKILAPLPAGGRELLCKLNHDALLDLYGERFFLFELSARRLNNVEAYFNTFRGHIDGLNAVTTQSAFSVIDNENIGKVFVDGSNLGGFVAEIKRRQPEVEVITFFHNVEARFFWGAFLARKTPRALAVLMANFLAERKAVRSSDKIVCLSDRDSRLLKRLYGRGATHIAPMALEDKCPAPFALAPTLKPEPFALFVGGTFYANQDGISWFVREVVPRIDLPIYIVGRGFEALRAELEVPGKVIVVGAVDSLADWYHRAQFIIAPIFDGSGMKTKVAEALMYGKKVVGTPEAFSGYEEITEKAGWVCRTADEFESAINTAKHEVDTVFDIRLREIYLQRYSLVAARKRLGIIISQPK